MTVPGVSPVAAYAYFATVEDPTRIEKSSTVGSYAGLTPRRYQSGQMDYSGRISKKGDPLLRTLLFEAASSLMTRRYGPPSPLKTWAFTLEGRIGHKKAAVALARKIAVILHRMWSDGTEFRYA